MFGSRHIYCPIGSVISSIPRIEELGIGIEVLLDDTSDLWPQVKWENLLEISDALSDSGLEVAVHGPFQSLSIGAPDAVVREYSMAVLMRGLEVARCFRAPTMVFHTGFLPQYPPRTRAKWMNYFSGNLERLLQKANELEVMLALENTYETDTGLFREIFQLFPEPPLGMCLDTSHATCYGKIDPALWTHEFADRICHVHCSDNDGKQDLHMDLGTGKVDFSSILAPLAAIESPASVTFETSLETAEISRDYFLALLQTIRPRDTISS